MKRLLTIFLLSALYIGLWSQVPKVPITVVGDLYIGNGAVMRSEGTVHVKALVLEKKAGKVDNYGNLIMDSVIFYTNDSEDGLLKNNPIPATVTANMVGARKTFFRNIWYMMSFPFDVDLNNVVNPLNGAKVTRGTDFEVQYYDSQERANRGEESDENWKVLPTGIDSLIAGKAYRVAALLSRLASDTIGAYAGRFSLDFFAKTTDGNIGALFNHNVKGVDLVFTSSPPGKFLTHKSEGWNPIGGLNTSNFRITTDPDLRSVESERTVYYTDTNGKWQEFYPGDASRVGTLRPFGVLFIKTDSVHPLSIDSLKFDFQRGRDGYHYGGYAYFTNGVTLGVANPAYLFRSSQTESYDLVKIQLTDTKNDTNSSPVYFRFDNKYSKFYRTSEDDVMMTTKSDTRPIVWGLAKEEGGEPDNLLFVNCLPYGENEVPLGVNIPVAGEYVLSMEKLITNIPVQSALLWDKVTGLKTELLSNDYRFQSNADNREDRFVVFFNRSITSIDPLPSTTEIYAYAADDILTVTNLLPGDKVQVTDMAGRIVASGMASGNTFSVALNQKGVYIVNTKGVKTLKVLNK